MTIGLRVLTVYSNSHSRNLTHFYYYDYKNNYRNSTPRRLPSIPPSKSRFEELGSEHGDGNHGDEDAEQGGDFGDGNPDGPGNDPPDDNGPGDHHDNEDPYDDGNQPNLADAIAALAHNVRSQTDSSQTKV